MIFVTGGAGFIGSNFIHYWFSQHDEAVVNIDKLTYAGNEANLHDIATSNHVFKQGDIGDIQLMEHLFETYQPRAVINFAAESHVDRSIENPNHFIQTNVVGLCNLLETARRYHLSLSADAQKGFRFLHVSTDEVYGSLGASDAPVTEESCYRPNNPYSASKAASDHFVRAYHNTFGLPTLVTNCSNNYGPRQYPEKLIPLTISNALKGLPLPVYGDGKQVRDWLHVHDHCRALKLVLDKGKPGSTYNIGGNNEQVNINVVRQLCSTLDALHLTPSGSSYQSLISFVTDRPGHDRRYAIDYSKIQTELGWAPEISFEAGLKETVSWYLNHQ